MIIHGMKVTDAAGQRINFIKATVRYVAKILSSFILMIGFIMVAFTAKKQGLHDFIAGTRVINQR
ncbi:MAG: RDD family protein [Gammaproteobacteria bacterium]|nr:RDD family protein [Gammaproteobacteria bacterium]MDX2486653.1 RDD family protein [Gammaproteobacteria bacterium]